MLKLGEKGAILQRDGQTYATCGQPLREGSDLQLSAISCCRALP